MVREVIAFARLLCLLPFAFAAAVYWQEVREVIAFARLLCPIARSAVPLVQSPKLKISRQRS